MCYVTTERYYKNKHIATEGGMLVFLPLAGIKSSGY